MMKLNDRRRKRKWEWDRKECLKVQAEPHNLIFRNHFKEDESAGESDKTKVAPDLNCSIVPKCWQQVECFIWRYMEWEQVGMWRQREGEIQYPQYICTSLCLFFLIETSGFDCRKCTHCLTAVFSYQCHFISAIWTIL